MPRLTEDQIKQGLLHPDIDVRFAALSYFAECYSPNPTVMPVVIGALERFGRTKAFQYSYPIAKLAQTEGTIRWAIEELGKQPSHTEDEKNYLDHLCRLLCNADPGLVLPHEKAILAARGFYLDYHKRLSRRLDLFSWDGDALWQELETICEEGKSKEYVGDIRWGEGKAIVEALARAGDKHADRMMALLAVKVDDFENNPMKWMEPLMVRLAGEMRHGPTIPIIVAKLHEDADVLSEECHRALVKIGTDDVIQAVRRDYPTAEWQFRLYASGVLGRVHTDLAVQAGIELLAGEKDLDLENWLAQAVVEHFSTEGNEAAYKVLLSDPDLFDLQRALVPACTLMGQEFPEFGEWRKEIAEKMTRKRSIFDRPASSPGKALPAPAIPRTPAATFIREEQKVGRNDPCTCGSGKKFKKCCMTKKPLV